MLPATRPPEVPSCPPEATAAPCPDHRPGRSRRPTRAPDATTRHAARPQTRYELGIAVDARASKRPRSRADTRRPGPRRRDRTAPTTLVRARPGRPAPRSPSYPSRLHPRRTPPGNAEPDVRPLAASSSAASSGPRPKNPNSASDAAPTSRPGNGTDPASPWRVPRAPQRRPPARACPSASNGPTATNVWVACRPTINRTTSATRICPPSAAAHNRAASTTGSPK